MESNKIWLSPPHQTGKELVYIQEALSENWLAPNGEQSRLFEKTLSSYASNRQVVSLASGTAAIHLALKALGVKRGDVVFCQSLTFVGSVNPVVYLGAMPVFIDSETLTWNICPQALEEALNHYKSMNQLPKAIIVVDLYGNPAQWNCIQAIASRYGIPIVEDAAEALGSSYCDKKAGTLGDIGIYSFNGNKIITTSGGGALLTSDIEIESKVRYWSAQAREKTIYYEHTDIGYNYQLSNVCAAIGRAQFECLEERVTAKRNIFSWYQNQLNGIVSFQIEPDNAFSNRWLTVIQFPENQPSQKSLLMKVFEEANIESRPVWKPMHMQPIYLSCDYFGGQNAEKLYKNGLCLPSGTKMKEEEFRRIEVVFKKCFG